MKDSTIAKSRADYVHCVRTGRYGEATTWCGRTSDGFTFADPTHAILNAANGGRLLACGECATAITLKEGSDL